MELRHGDRISLLPDSLRYSVELSGGEKYSVELSGGEKEEEVKEVDKRDSAADGVRGVASSSGRKRVLPGWLRGIADSAGHTSSNKSTTKRKRRPKTPPTSNNPPATPTADSSHCSQPPITDPSVGDPSVSDTPNSEPNSLPPCPYGANCYRYIDSTTVLV